jgi:hypothetical protein
MKNVPDLPALVQFVFYILQKSEQREGLSSTDSGYITGYIKYPEAVHFDDVSAAAFAE